MYQDTSTAARDCRFFLQASPSSSPLHRPTPLFFSLLSPKKPEPSDSSDLLPSSPQTGLSSSLLRSTIPRLPSDLFGLLLIAAYL